MKNPNVYKFKGNIESAIKNGDIQQFIVLPGILDSFKRNFENFSDKKEIESEKDFEYKQTLIKFYSPFRIGKRQIRLIQPNNIISRDSFNKKEFINLIQNICKRYKNTITAIPINGYLTQYYDEIIDTLNAVVRDAKMIILN